MHIRTVVAAKVYDMLNHRGLFHQGSTHLCGFLPRKRHLVYRVVISSSCVCMCLCLSQFLPYLRDGWTIALPRYTRYQKVSRVLNGYRGLSFRHRRVQFSRVHSLMLLVQVWLSPRPVTVANQTFLHIKIDPLAPHGRKQPCTP